MRRRLAIVLITAIAGASVALNGWLALLLYRAFADLQYARVFPIGAPAEGRQPTASDARPLIALYGDSRSLHWNAAALTREYRVQNLAQGGMTSAQLLLELQSRPPVRSDWAILQIGINDLHPLGALPERTQAIRTQLDSDLSQIVAALKGRSACVIVATIIPPGPTPIVRKLTWDDATLEAIAAANGAVAAQAEPGRVWVLDAHKLLRDDTGRLAARFRLAGSFLHVNSQAYDVLNREVLSILVSNRPQASGGSPCLMRYGG